MKKTHPNEEPKNYKQDYNLVKTQLLENIEKGEDLIESSQKLAKLTRQENNLTKRRQYSQIQDRKQKLQKRQIITENDILETGQAAKRPKTEQISCIDNLKITSTDLTKLINTDGIPNKDWLGDGAVDSFLNLVWEKTMRSQLTNQNNVPFKTRVLSAHFSTKILTDHKPLKTGIKATYRLFKDKNSQNSLDFDLILSPIVAEKHWTLMAFRPKQKTITRYNSIDRFEKTNYTDKFEKFLKYVEKVEGHEPTDWTKNEKEFYGNQCDGHNCGVFVCAAAERLLQNLPLTDSVFDRHTIQSYRTRIVKDLVDGKYK